MEESSLILPIIFVISEYVIILISKGLEKNTGNRCFGRNSLNFYFDPILGVNIFKTLKKICESIFFKNKLNIFKNCL